VGPAHELDHHERLVDGVRMHGLVLRVRLSLLRRELRGVLLSETISRTGWTPNGAQRW
jgi:hypothetical protein